ncbi:hypothetical protein GWK47_036990 [Chionoecetes opilio]|uniref:Uncharacterized protein n=1 Tax=Chionoecetes opilio TaxID=41210 RepID=A0A8J4YM30_CHIOP|nr:hypothetical protein GWK47_036990 [Chionoecetes opilio]
MEVDAPLPPMAPKPATGGSPLAAHGQSPARRCERATQTLARTYTFQEADLVDVLVTYENLVCQETAAPLPEDLPRAGPLPCEEARSERKSSCQGPFPSPGPLNRPHHFTTMSGEGWVQFPDDQQTEDQDTDDDPPAS